MRRSKSRSISNFAAGAIALVIVVVGTYLGFAKGLPFTHHYTLKAIFRSSNNLHKASPVRIAGVNVGKVATVKPLPGGADRSLVTMQIEDKGLPIHKDATVQVRPRIFLEGNFFVDLKPGSPTAGTVHDGDTLPVQQASAPVQLDQILTSLQADTRHNLQLLLNEYGRGVKLGGEGFNRSITYWLPAYKNGAIVNAATLGQKAHDLSGYIKESGTVAEALDRNPQQLKSLITDFNTTAAAFASQSNSLSAAIAELPRTLRVGQPALLALDNAFPPTRALAAALRPAVRSTGPMIDASLPFITQARLLVSQPELRGLVADRRPTVPALARLQSSSVPLYQQVRLASSCQNVVVLPWTLDKVHDNDPSLEPKGPVYYEAPKPLVGLTGESRTGDANGIYFRVLGGGGANTYGFQSLAANPSVGTTNTPIEG
ncbi:MAG: phospholipid/cholesterol/gamma-HCH transport system substrate-binding protein, partial [Solirubrobacteraceae bacterium]|nr:phospholipid/cholesterol/gamma-HCH transport system substrate-binding protein [Solirubrobacteraceae bacterium]